MFSTSVQEVNFSANGALNDEIQQMDCPFTLWSLINGRRGIGINMGLEKF